MKLTKSQLREIIREELLLLGEAKKFKTIENLLKILKNDSKFKKYYTEDRFNFYWNIPIADLKKLGISFDDLKKLGKIVKPSEGEIDIEYHDDDDDDDDEFGSVGIYISK